MQAPFSLTTDVAEDGMGTHERLRLCVLASPECCKAPPFGSCLMAKPGVRPSRFITVSGRQSIRRGALFRS